MKRNAQRAPARAVSPLGISRIEALALLTIVAAGLTLRAVALSQSAVEHFDEGVYASNVYFGPPDYGYPDQRFYAPPLLPALIEAGMIAGLAPNLAALLPSFLAGCGMIVALWWLGRTWFTPRVGLATAMLCALSDFHVAYSATALTDVLLGLWLVLAVQAAGLSLWNGDLRWAVAAGLFTGLAWWTKYNGWLPLAIEAAGIGLLWVTAATAGDSGSAGASPSRASPSRWLVCLAGTALTAVGIWAPYYLALQSNGGYGPIAANHARYVVGLAGWPDALARHVAAQHVMQGWLSPIGVGATAALVALLALLASGRSLTGKSALAVALLAVGLAVLAFVGSSFVLVTTAAAAGLILGWVQWLRPSHKHDDRDRSLIGLALLTAWWCGLAVATPCYWPYPRLLVPWLLASWLPAAAGLDMLLERWLETLAERATWRLSAAVVGLLVLAALGGWTLCPPASATPGDRRGLQAVARQVQHDLKTGNGRAGQSPRAVFYVYGEPALLFQLRAAGEPLVVPIQRIPVQEAADNGRPLPTYLLVGPHAFGDRQFQRDWAAHRESYELVGSYPVALSPIVSLDLADPRHPLGAQEQPNRVEVHRLREKPSRFAAKPRLQHSAGWPYNRPAPFSTPRPRAHAPPRKHPPHDADVAPGENREGKMDGPHGRPAGLDVRRL